MSTGSCCCRHPESAPLRVRSNGGVAGARVRGAEGRAAKRRQLPQGVQRHALCRQQALLMQCGMQPGGHTTHSERQRWEAASVAEASTATARLMGSRREATSRSQGKTCRRGRKAEAVGHRACGCGSGQSTSRRAWRNAAAMQPRPWMRKQTSQAAHLVQPLGHAGPLRGVASGAFNHRPAQAVAQRALQAQHLHRGGRGGGGAKRWLRGMVGWRCYYLARGGTNAGYQWPCMCIRQQLKQKTLTCWIYSCCSSCGQAAGSESQASLKKSLSWRGRRVKQEKETSG